MSDSAETYSALANSQAAHAPSSPQGLRVLWLHNFDPGIPVSGVFMHLLADAMQANGIRVDMLYAGKLTQPLDVWRAYAQLKLLAPSFDLVHAQYGSMCGLIGSWVAGCKLMSLRGSDWYGLPSGDWRERAHLMLANWLSRLAVPRYNQVITMSHNMKREVEARFAGQLHRPVHVLPDGLSTQHFCPMDRQVCRAQLGCAQDTRPWVLVTTLVANNPIKRIELALAAVELAKKYIPDLQLKITANVPHEQMPVWVNACNMVLMTSLHEGWPNAIKESLACNVPFVSTDVSDLAGIAAQEPSCAVVAAQPQALADAIVACLGHHNTANLRHCVQGMDVDVVAKNLGLLYRQVLESPCAA